MSKFHYIAVCILCGFLLQGCDALVTAGLFWRPPDFHAVPYIHDTKLVSVNKIQTNPRHPERYALEIVFSSKINFDDFVEKHRVSLWGNVVFCSDKDEKLRNSMITRIYHRDIVDKENKPLVPEPDGSYMYSTLISVNSRDNKEAYINPDTPPYDLAVAPQDVCSRIYGSDMRVSYDANWIVVPKEMIVKALVLPPDPERSAAWQRQADNESKPNTKSRAWVKTYQFYAEIRKIPIHGSD